VISDANDWSPFLLRREFWRLGYRTGFSFTIPVTSGTDGEIQGWISEASSQMDLAAEPSEPTARAFEDESWSSSGTRFFLFVAVLLGSAFLVGG